MLFSNNTAILSVDVLCYSVVAITSSLVHVHAFAHHLIGACLLKSLLAHAVVKLSVLSSSTSLVVLAMLLLLVLLLSLSLSVASLNSSYIRSLRIQRAVELSIVVK